MIYAYKGTLDFLSALITFSRLLPYLSFVIIITFIIHAKQQKKRQEKWGEWERRVITNVYRRDKRKLRKLYSNSVTLHAFLLFNLM